MLFTMEVPPRGFFWTNAPEELIDQVGQANLADWLKTGHMRGWNERPSRGRSVLELRAHRAERQMKRYMWLDATAFVARAEAHLDMRWLKQPRKLGCYERFMSQEWRRDMLDAVISENLERVRLFMEEEAASAKAPSPIVQAFRDELMSAVDREVNVLFANATAALNAQEAKQRDAEQEQRRRHRLMEAERAAQRELAILEANSRAKRMMAHLGLSECTTQEAVQLLQLEVDPNQSAPVASTTAAS